jgi:hypothetical protein
LGRQRRRMVSTHGADMDLLFIGSMAAALTV